MPETLWLIPKNESGPLALVLDEQGRLVLCSECPCVEDEDCVQSVDDKVSEMLAETLPGTEDLLWSLQGTQTASYSCATWSQDPETGVWSLVSRASGSLLVALRRGSAVSDTTDGAAVLLTYAKTLVNNSTHAKTVVGCRCRVSRHECLPRLVRLDGYDLAGTLPVWEPSAGESYLPADSCRVDDCELLELKLRTAQLWHGGSLYGEGYYDWLLSPGSWESANYRYQPFLMAVKWTPTGQASRITYLDCNCTGISTHVLAAGETVLEYPGICTMQDPCMAMMLLHNKAVANDWEWHGEGVIAHLAACTVNGSAIAYGDWYVLRDMLWESRDYGYAYDDESVYPSYSRALCCAETPDGYWVVDCDCSATVYYAKNAPVPGYHNYFELAGVCACSMTNGHTPDRELLLTYPQEFGVVDVVWGNDNEFVYTYSYQWYDGNDEDGATPHWVTSSYAGKGICGTTEAIQTGVYGRTMYIDYRAMCFIGKAFDAQAAQKLMVRVIYPSGSRGAPYDYQYHQTRYYAPSDTYYIASAPAVMDTVEFDGHFTPFSSNADIGYTVTYSDGRQPQSYYGADFTGYAYMWGIDVSVPEGVRVNGCQPTETCNPYYDSLSDEEIVRELAGCGVQAPTICIDVSTRDADSGVTWKAAALLSPDFTTTFDQTCSYRWNGSEWCYTERWATYGANTYNQDGVCLWQFLNIHYVCTNRGFIVKGLNGYRTTYTLPGVGNYPQYANCYPWTDYSYDDPDDMPPHWLDEVITCPADEDMHYCVDGFMALSEE